MRLALAAVVALPFVAAHIGEARSPRHIQQARQAPSPPPSGSHAPAASSPAVSSAAPTPSSPPASAATSPPGQPTPPPNTVPVTFSLLSTNPAAVPLASINANAPSAPTQALASTVPAGTTPSSIPNAPGLPDVSGFNPRLYPPLDLLPPIDSPEVQQWIQDVNNSGIKIPPLEPTQPGGCPNNTAFAQNATRCWWTCGGCTREEDISDCPDRQTWGLTYDDGPAYYTTELLSYLDQQNLKSTFFVVGSRITTFYDILRAEYIAGHQIAVHTWSHPPLTTLTNEQIIAELGWTKKIIKDVLGVTPNMMRPPYGDIDDRVRGISMAMGLTPVMWTRISPMATFDTGDFNVHAGLTTVEQVLSNWQTIMNNVTTRSNGFVVLEHDLFQQTVEIATGYILPDGIARGLTIEPVNTCLKRPLADAYIETNDNKTNPPPVGVGANGITGPSTTSTNPGGTGTGSGTGSGSNGGSKGSGAVAQFHFDSGVGVVAVTLLASVLSGVFGSF